MSQNRFEQKFTKTESCWIWNAALGTTGYGAFSFQGKRVTASRFAYELYKGDIKNGLHVLHTCDNPRCVNPDHLFLGTNSDNVSDRILKDRRVGRLPVCSDAEVLQIQKLLETKKLSIREIARQTCQHRSTVHRISKGTLTLQRKN